MFVLIWTLLSIFLKGVWHEIFDFRFFSWISVPRAYEYSLGAASIFSKIRGDIREWMFITGVNDTGDMLFTGVNDISDKFIAGDNDTGDKFVAGDNDAGY